MAKTFTIQMELLPEKETKGALRYAELTSDGKRVEDMHTAVIGTLYIRKTAMAGAKPTKLTVTIAEAA